jgi:hypothetical protein
MRRLTKEQVNQFLATGHYIMRGKATNECSQAQRDWHRLQVEKAMQQNQTTRMEPLLNSVNSVNSVVCTVLKL